MNIEALKRLFPLHGARRRCTGRAAAPVVAEVVLARADKMNALDGSMFDALLATIELGLVTHVCDDPLAAARAAAQNIATQNPDAIRVPPTERQFEQCPAPLANCVAT